MANDEAFKHVPLNTNEQNACSPPEPEPSWRGIVIRAPSTGYFRRGRTGIAFDPIPICGLYALDATSIAFGSALEVIVFDSASSDTLRGQLGEDDPNPSKPPPEAEPLDPKLLEGVVVQTFFNSDLARAVALPGRPGAYEVAVELGRFRSNRVRIELVEAP